MAEITAEGYQDLRDYIEGAWDFIELRDDVGTAVLRIDPTDPRVTWTHTPGAQTLELTVVITGADGEFQNIEPGDLLPQVLAASAIYKVVSGGDPFSVESFTSFTLSTVDDELTVKHRIQVPQVV